MGKLGKYIGREIKDGINGAKGPEIRKFESKTATAMNFEIDFVPLTDLTFKIENAVEEEFKRTEE